MAKIKVSINDYWFLEVINKEDFDFFIEHYKGLGIKVSYDTIFSAENPRAIFWVGKKTPKISKLIEKHKKPFWRTSDSLPVDVVKADADFIKAYNEGQNPDGDRPYEVYVLTGKKTKQVRQARVRPTEKVKNSEVVPILSKKTTTIKG